MKALPWASWNDKAEGKSSQILGATLEDIKSADFFSRGFEKVYLRAKGGALDGKKSGLAEKIESPLLFLWFFWKVSVGPKFFPVDESASEVFSKC